MRTIIQRLALMAGLPVLALLGAAAGQPGGAGADSGQEITFRAAVCPKWGIVPANEKATEWDETGHGASLNASADTTLADESDIPHDCDDGKDWTFTIADSINGDPLRKVAVDGHESITLSDEETKLLVNGGLYVRSFTPAGLHFAGLRCFDDVAFGDNVELVWADSSALPVKTLECIAFAVPASQQVTFIQAVCKNWASVPANTNPKEWDETGHGGELNGAADTSLADPADIGSGCERSNGWKFTLAGSQNDEPFRSVGPTAPDGSSTESLTGEEIEALSNGGLWVRSVVKSGYQFAGLRCYDDVNYSDNLELIYIPGNETPKGGVYCIAFAVKHVSGEKLSPVLECVIDLGATSTNTAGRYVAIFGYNNPNSESVKIEVGSNNKFTPAPQQRGQPEEFQPGRQPSVFKVEFSGGNLVWTLNGKTSTASPNSARCSP